MLDPIRVADIKLLFAESCIKLGRFLKDAETGWVSNIKMKLVPLKYGRRKKQVLKVIMSLLIAGILLLSLVLDALFKFKTCK